jgi:zona occludens toxin
MITFISGAPGTGKTACLIDLLLDHVKDRALFACNVEGLLLDHVELKDPYNWMTEVPDGALVVIDEVQRFWRTGGSGATLPASIAALETHRHRGLDFYILSQGPNLIHANVRALVGRHIHLRNVGILGRHWYEWPECCDTVRTSWKTAPIKHSYKLPKRAFQYYKSASMHIKPVFGFPRALVIAIAAIAGCLFLGWNFYKSVFAPKASASAKPSTSAPLSPSTQSSFTANFQQAQSLDERVSFMPVIRGRPWTAPAYDHLRLVVAMPNITSAICINDDCKCFNGYSRLDISPEDCKVWSIERPFNPYVPSAIASGNTNYQQPNAQSVSSSPAMKPSEVISSVSPL